MRIKKIIGCIALIALLVGVLWIYPEEQVASSIKLKKLVEVETLSQGVMSKTFKVNGIVKDAYDIYGVNLIQEKVSEVLVKEGDIVKVGTPLIKIDTLGDYDSVDYQIKQLQGSIREIQLSLDQLSKHLRKQRKLLVAGAISEHEINSLEDQKNQERLRLEKLKEQVQQMKTSKENIYAKSVIKSSCDGVVTELTIENGSYVTGEDQLIIKKNARQYIRVDVTEKFVKFMESGTQVKVEVNEIMYTGSILEVLKNENMMYPVKITISEKIKSGKTAVVTVPVYKKEDALLITNRAIIKYGGESFVYCVKNGIVEKKHVTIGKSKNVKSEVLSGLTLNDLVITKGQFSVSEGEEVECSEVFN